jgi:hypothetical protein
MSPKPDKKVFYGTYFDRDMILRWVGWTRVIAWAIFAIYVLQYSYDTGMTIYNSLMGGYPMDLFYFIFNIARPFQGAMILVILHLLSGGLLILLDIEDNTRRAARKQD